MCAAAGNGFHNKINTSLFVETATFMKDSGLLAAGYDLVTLGGIGYANGSTWPDGQQGWGPAGPIPFPSVCLCAGALPWGE